MFVYSVKAQTLKLYSSIVLSVLSVILVIALVPFNGIKEDFALQAGKNIEEKNFKNIQTAKDRIAFLKQFGWEVETEARDVTQVTIPVKFDPIYEKYNDLQIKEGLDLEKYKGKTVKKYTYLVNNHEYEGIVYANLLIYKDQVIGGDISSAAAGGFMHGFSKGNLSLT
ncbi:MAG: DUF4830 domain-containing protein [Ruminococcaceae bacterium]|nr:DUF4830 domain-containing protein [Oscillospiraceae bacterium]